MRWDRPQEPVELLFCEVLDRPPRDPWPLDLLGIEDLETLNVSYITKKPAEAGEKAADRRRPEPGIYEVAFVESELLGRDVTEMIVLNSPLAESDPLTTCLPRAESQHPSREVSK